jgi:hypothetical protein
MDYKNDWGTNAPNLIPPFLAPIDPWIVETATDNAFVTLVGDDVIPEMLVGRIPANTSNEVSDIVNKILDYETSAGPHLWYATQLIVSDDPEFWLDFHDMADAVFGRVVAPFMGRRMYFAADEAPQSYMYSNAEDLKSAIISHFDAGAGLITYVGHSSWLRWAHETLLHVDNILGLNNQSRLPVVLQLTCYTSRFHDPRWYNTFDEALLRRANGGAVGTFGSTGEGATTGQELIQQGFYAAITNTDTPEVTLGAATLAGELQAASSGYGYMLHTYTLFGDPATHLKMNTPAGEWDITQVYLPFIVR